MAAANGNGNNYARQPIEVDAETVLLLEREMFEQIKSFFERNLLPKTPKRQLRQGTDGKYDNYIGEASDEVTAARIAVMMTDAAMSSLWASNRLTIAVPKAPDVSVPDLSIPFLDDDSEAGS
jgi:hypothetical protein